MPGLTGIISKITIGDEVSKLDRMLNIMKHEPFYTSGCYKKFEIGIYIGCTSIENSFSDCMPIYNEKKDLVLFLTGECFVDKEIISSLLSRGHKFNPDNASFLIHLFEEQGDIFFGNLNGWFSGIILDLRREKANILLFNDRYGKRRIYYHENDEAFYFSSEAKSLLKIFPSLRRVDYESLGEYMTYDCTFNNRTLFSDIYMLPPGSVWSFRDRNIEKKLHYEQSKLENQTKITKNQFYKELGETFERILPRYFSGSSKMLGLTGGLDTRMIMACINPAPGELPCYTHGGMYNDMLDVRIASKVAKVCNQTHRVIRLDERFLSDFPTQVERTIYITDGLANVCQGYQIFCNKAARQIAPIRITGKFGSQVLKYISALHRPTGYDADEQLTNQAFKKYISAGKERFSEISKGHQLSFMIFKELPWWWGGNSTAEFSQLTVRSPYLDNDFVNLIYRSPFTSIDVEKFQMGVIHKNNPKLSAIMTDKGFGGSSSPFISNPQKMLYKIINYTEKAYNRDKLPYSLQHWVAKIDYHLLSPLHLNKVFLGLGDYRHFRLWFRDELSEYLKEVILDNRTLNRPFWNKKFLKRIVYDHIKGRKNYLPEIRKVLTLELIIRLLLEDI